jgi:hypothetical protein
MKKLNIIFVGIFSFLLLFSCQKAEKDPVLNTSQIVAPGFTSPNNGDVFVLLEDNKDQILTRFNWSATSYNLADLANTSYKLEMDLKANSFSDPIFLLSTTELEVSYTVGAMNQLLLNNGFPVEQASELSFRITSNITANNSEEMSISTPITLSLTPYSEEVSHKSLYLLGDGTDAGWDNNSTLEVSYIAEGKFGIVTNLGGEGLFFKFISVQGQWAPMWGTDDAGTGEGGNLVYRPTEDVTDPPAIPCPAAAGLYRIVADTANLTYEVYQAPASLYLLGDGSTAGWDNTAALEMTNDGNGKFSITTDLTAASIKFIEVPGQWAPQWGSVDGIANLKGGIAFRPTEADPDPANIPVSTAGTYLIEVDLAAQTYKLSPQ